MPNHFVLVVHNRQFDPSEISTLITTTRKCKARTCLFNNEENELKVTKTKKSFILEMANTTQIELNVTLKNTEFETSADQKFRSADITHIQMDITEANKMELETSAD